MLQVYDRSGSANRCLNLGNQDYLDVLLSNDRHQKALLLKVSKEYDLVSSGESEWVVYTFRLLMRKSSCNLIQVVRGNLFFFNVAAGASCVSIYNQILCSYLRMFAV